MNVNSGLLLGLPTHFLASSDRINQPSVVCLARHRVAVSFEGAIYGCLTILLFAEDTFRLNLQSFEAELGGVVECRGAYLLDQFRRVLTVLQLIAL